MVHTAHARTRFASAVLTVMAMLSLAPPAASIRGSDAARAVAPIPITVLLLIPDDFQALAYRSTINGKATVHPFGTEAREQFRRILGPEFQSLEIRQVSSKSAAVEMLSPNHPEHSEVRSYDFIGIPVFTGVNAWVEKPGYRFEIDMAVEFQATDGSKAAVIRGYGESRGAVGPGAQPFETGNLALWYAVEAMRDAIAARRNLFVPAYGAPQPGLVREPPPVEADEAPAVVPLPYKVLLVIPREFSESVYRYSTQGRETAVRLGEKAEAQFRRLLGPQFDSLAVQSVPDEAAAMDLLSEDSPNNATLRGFDYMALPRFAGVKSWLEAGRHGFGIDLEVVFHSTDGLRNVKFNGYGEFSTGVYGRSSVSPAVPGHRALKSAIEVIRQSIDHRRALFHHGRNTPE